MRSEQAEAALITWLVELEQSVPFETWVASTGALEPEVRSLYERYVATGSRLRAHAAPREDEATSDGGSPPRRIGRYLLLRPLGSGGTNSPSSICAWPNGATVTASASTARAC